MNVCRICGGPMMWTVIHNRTWCAVYGDHRHPQPTALMLAADAELEALDRSVLSRFKRKARHDSVDG